jgi:hypothetical protein
MLDKFDICTSFLNVEFQGLKPTHLELPVWDFMSVSMLFKSICICAFQLGLTLVEILSKYKEQLEIWYIDNDNGRQRWKAQNGRWRARLDLTHGL